MSSPHSEHDDKGYSEEKCVRCGWVMGQPPLNCQNDDTPHVFPSQQRLEEQYQALREAIANALPGPSVSDEGPALVPMAAVIRVYEALGSNPASEPTKVARCPECGSNLERMAVLDVFANQDSDPARSLDDIDPKELGDGVEATVEPGGPMTEADLDAFDPASRSRP